jgi:hypothetical protein
MTENRETTARQYYWASEIPTLIGATTPSLSSFYRCVASERIHKIDSQGQPDTAYNGEDVRRFLRGELTRRKGDAGRGKSSSRQKRLPSREGDLGSLSASVALQSLTIDVARYEDLYDLYGLEISQVGLLDAIAPPTYISWLQANDHAYWMMFEPGNRKDIVAMLGVLPLRQEVVQRLLRREIMPSQITASDVLGYKPDSKFGVYIISAATKPDKREAIIPLVHRLFSYWCEESIVVESVSASVGDSNEDTPLMRIMTECFFVPLSHEKDQWELHPLDRSYQVDFIKNYQKCIQDRNEMGKEKSSMLVLDKPTKPLLDDLRHIYRRSLERKGNEDYTAKVHGIVDVDAEGYVTRRDGNNTHKVWVGRMRNDDDIRATLRINASLFGASAKFTEDQLVEFRRAWLKKNPDIYRVLEIDGEVVGFIFAMPLPMPVIDRILLSEIRVGDISIEDLQEYRPGQPPVYVYLQTLGLHAKIQGGEKYFAGSYLIAGMERLITDIGSQGVEVGGIFTRSDEADGLKMIGGMGFEEMPDYSERVGKLVFSLDFAKDKPSLRAYKRALEVYESHRVVEDGV